MKSAAHISSGGPLFRLMLLAVLAALPHPAQARHYFTTRYDLRDGLPHSSVFRIFSDRQGLLRFSTDYGLARFDGRSFGKDFGDRGGLLNTAVFCVSERANGNRLIGTSKDCLLELSDTDVRRLAPPGSDSLVALYAFELPRAPTC